MGRILIRIISPFLDEPLDPFREDPRKTPVFSRQRPQNWRCGRVEFCGDCDIHGGGCTKAGFLVGVGAGPVTPAKGVRPVGLAMSFSTGVKERTIGLNKGWACRLGSGAATRGWKRLAVAGAFSEGGGSMSARKRSMFASCSSVD